MCGNGEKPSHLVGLSWLASQSEEERKAVGVEYLYHSQGLLPVCFIVKL